MERRRSSRRRQKPPFAQRAKEHFRQIIAFLFSNVGIIILVVIYMIGGAFMFMAIEGEHSETPPRHKLVADLRNSVLTEMWQISLEENRFNETSFSIRIGAKIKSYQEYILKYGKNGYTFNETEKDGSKWEFSGAFLYSLTVITTIGYGNIAPVRNWGKIATIFYAIIGMPLFLLYLSNIGDVLAKSFKWIYAKLFLCRICPRVTKRRAARQRRKMRALRMDADSMDEDDSHLDEEDSVTITSASASAISENFSESIGDESSQTTVEDTSTITVPITTCLVIMIGYIFAGAKIFQKSESWEDLDGCYFCFISLSSIGFGDIVPGKIMNLKDSSIQRAGSVSISPDGWKFIVCAIYLLLGMALIAMCFNLMQEQVIQYITTIKRSIRRCFRCNSCRCRT